MRRFCVHNNLVNSDYFGKSFDLIFRCSSKSSSPIMALFPDSLSQPPTHEILATTTNLSAMAMTNASSSLTATTTTVTILGRPNQSPYVTLAASIVNIFDSTTTFTLGCRPDSLLVGDPSTYPPCTESKATITAGPSMFAYLNMASETVSCTQRREADKFTCWARGVGDQGQQPSVFLVNEQGFGGRAELLVTAGVEKLNDTGGQESTGGHRTGAALGRQQGGGARWWMCWAVGAVGLLAAVL